MTEAEAVAFFLVLPWVLLVVVGAVIAVRWGPRP